MLINRGWIDNLRSCYSTEFTLRSTGNGGNKEDIYIRSKEEFYGYEILNLKIMLFIFSSARQVTLRVLQHALYF